MPATKFTVIDPNGVKHKRSSVSRTYTHAVVSRPDYERDVAIASLISAIDMQNFDYHQDMVAAGGVRARGNWMNDEYVAKELARHTAAIAGFADRESYGRAQRDARLARIEAQKAAGYYETYTCAGWCGRRDLAHKLKAQQQGWRLDVTILEVQG